MKASSAYPVDSLRSGEFTQKYGIATTIMDYARYNYIAQPGDENIRFVRQLGPYDDYSIEWGYRYYDQSPEEEKKILSQFVDEKSLDPMYMFGGRGNDPDAQTENIGDDPVKASFYGLKNLKIVARNLMEWTLQPNDDYTDLNELYGELTGVYRRYINHVHSIIGGVNKTQHTTNQQDVVTYKSVEKAKQIEALAFLNTHVWETQAWLMQPQLISEIKSEGILLNLQNLQRSAMTRLLATKNLNRLLSTQNTLEGNGLTVNELLNILFNDIIKNVSKPDVSRQSLQIHFAHQIKILQEEEKLNPTIKASLVDLECRLHKIAKRKARMNAGDLKKHYAYLAEQTDD
jgi:hypothetical protein